MADSSPPSPGLCQGLTREPAPRAKRLSDSAVQLQALQSAKKACVLRRGCSTPDPAGNPLSPSPGSGCSLFLDESGQDELAASFSVSKYDDVAISLDTSRCFDDSELDDSLLELSGSEKGSSPFDYTEEEIQEILADDSTEAEQQQQQHLAGESHLSPSASGESDRAESSGCTAGSELASEVTEEPKEGQEALSGSSDPGFLSGSVALDGAQLQQELDLDLQELLSLSPFAAACADGALEENNLEGETLDAMIDDCLGYSTAAGSCLPEKPTEGVMPKGQESLAEDCPGESVPSSHLPCGQGTGDEGPAPVCPPKKELPKATTSCSLWKSGSPEDAEGKPTGAEQPPGSTELSDTAVGQTGQEEPPSGKKSGRVIPVPQEEEEERPKPRICILEAQPEQKKRFSPGCAHPSEEKCAYYLRELCTEGEGEIPWKLVRILSTWWLVAFKSVNPTNEDLGERNHLPVPWGQLHLISTESQDGLGWKGHKNHLSQGRNTSQYPRLFQSLSNPALDTSRDGNSQQAAPDHTREGLMVPPSLGQEGVCVLWENKALP